jgi:Zn-dependent protease
MHRQTPELPKLKQFVRDPSFRILSVYGVPVHAQLSFLAFPLWAASMGWFSGPPRGESALQMALYILGLYGLALLHELGHILPARLFGASITRIRVSGMGVFVRIHMKGGMTPRQDLLIALGGPLVSALLSAVLVLFTWRALGSPAIHDAAVLLLQRDGLALPILLSASNVLLTLFNLLPVFPMDGGRALSALLAQFLAPQQASRVVSVFGQVLAGTTVPSVLLLTGDFSVRLLAVMTAGFVFWVSLKASRNCEAQRQPTPPT